MLTTAQKALLGYKDPLPHLHKYLNQKRGVARLRYDFAVQGGAVGSLTLADEDGDAFSLPSGAIVTQVYLDIITACVSTSNDGTVAVTLNSSGDLLAAVDADTLPLTPGHPTPGIPVGTAATMVKATAARSIVLEIATHALTAGKFDVFVEFVLGGT